MLTFYIDSSNLPCKNQSHYDYFSTLTLSPLAFPKDFELPVVQVSLANSALEFLLRLEGVVEALSVRADAASSSSPLSILTLLFLAPFGDSELPMVPESLAYSALEPLLRLGGVVGALSVGADVASPSSSPS